MDERDESEKASSSRKMDTTSVSNSMVVIQLEPNASKVCHDDDMDHKSGDQYNEGIIHGNFINKELNENVDQEVVNQSDLHGDSKDDEAKMKESMRFLLKRHPEMHTFVQMLAAGSMMSTKCEGKHCNSLGTSKLQESYSNKECERASPADKVEKLEEVNSCPELATAAEREVFSLKLSFRENRKVDFVSSPILVAKVNSRTNRQPSKICKSPHTGTKRNIVPKIKRSAASVGEVTKGLNLADLELRAIRFVLEELASNSNKDLVCIDGINVTARHLNCLVRPVEENGVENWLGSRIIECYAAMFNSDWKKGYQGMKHALYTELSQWLQEVGRDWIKTSVPWRRMCHHFAQSLVGADMVFIPMNTTKRHWWLGVPYPAKNEFQVLDSFNSPKDYEEETMELRCGIHSILQSVMSSSKTLKSRWSNYDILKWDVVVKKNIPQQHDRCSCGIFTIKYMQYWNGSEITSPFSQKDMEPFRKKIPAELVMSPFNELTSIRDHVLAMEIF